MSDGILIREGKEEDSEAIAAFIGELARYEGYTAWLDDVESIRTNGSSDSPWFHTFVAETKNEGAPQLVGMTLYYYCYSMLHGRCVHMEVLYVSPEHQGKGIGTKLWKAVAMAGVAKGCNLMDIGAREANERAMNFYKSHGAYDLTEKFGVHMLFMNKDEMYKFAKHN